MKKARVFALALAFCLILTAFCPSVLAESAPDISAKSAFVIDMNSNTVLYEKDADSRVEPASTTKIMTLLLVCEAVERGDISFDDAITAQENDLELGDDDASTVDIKPGEVLTLRDLCYCAMLCSANEACNIAASHVAGSVANFVDLMNEKAVVLGCTDTHFKNTNGLPSAEHYTTARELAIITQEALKHEAFREFCNTTEYTVPATNLGESRPLSNSNALINPKACYGDKYYYEGAYGVKTGHTENAGYCLVSAVKTDELDMLTVVLGADGDGVMGEYFNNFADTIALLDYCRETWHNTVVLSQKETLGNIPVEMGTEKEVSLSPAYDISMLLPKGFDSDSLERDLTMNIESLTAPFRAGTVVGKVAVKNADGEVLFTTDLVTSDEVRASIVDYFIAYAKNFIEGHLLLIGGLLIGLIVVVFFVTYIPSTKKGKSKK